MSFTRPTHRILTEEDLKIWEQSNTYEELVEFVKELAENVRGKKISDEVKVSSGVDSVLKALDRVKEIILKHPVVKDKEVSRFGKPEFRDFYDDLKLNEASLLSTIEGMDQKAINEISTYFQESWGNRTRIDYGSGHELNFICFLLCLKKLGVLSSDDSTAIVLRIFKKYLDMMRILQTEYWLEPAGSHGVWGLDDYHFLPFLFGAAQLSNHEYLKPKSIHNSEVVEEFAKDYFYFECISFINNVKTESLRWHSPMLDDISAVRTWKKVEEGMFKMFKGEVLNKLPIIQHFFFGSLIKSPEGVSVPPLMADDSEDGDNDDNLSVHQHFGDCCGIKVPAAFGAHMKKTLPFD